MADFVSLSEKLDCGLTFRKHVERAIELDPSDALAYHLLGRWCFEVGDEAPEVFFYNRPPH